jgi:hypothetical protein
MTSAQWSAHVLAGTAPAMTMNGRTKVITLEAARAWEEAEGRRVCEALTFAAEACAE